MATKTLVKAQYIAHLQARYSFYVEGSRQLELANQAVDAALAGTLKLQGECWTNALVDCGLSKRITMRELAELPA